MSFKLDKYWNKHPDDVRKAKILAIIYKRTTIISYGFNRRIMTTSKNEHGNYTKVFTRHAEESAIRKAGSRCHGANMLVIRLKRDGTFGNAKCCKYCQILINNSGIQKIYYST